MCFKKERLLSFIPYPVYMEKQKKAIRKYRIKKKFTKKGQKTPQKRLRYTPETFCGDMLMCKKQ